jgi:radical SAM superfamily enzyme YgiQ (UPF0313 family)
VRVVLVSTYDLGRQPFGLASPAAWLRQAGHEVRMLDLAVEDADEAALSAADAIAFHLPMHTATRMAVALVPWIRGLNPRAKLAFYGLYAPVNESLLRRLGADVIVGGEFERELLEAFEPAAMSAAAAGPRVVTSFDRLAFEVPDRAGLPALERYARLRLPGGELRVVGATEASRGCKHRCRHCPIVPVYDGRFRIVPAGVVLEDVRRQVEAGAEHITFGDPDFWNGIGHALPLIERMHAEHPALTYDVTIKVEHLLKHREHLATLRRTGCVFVTSAVESLDDAVLERLDKGHTRNDFLAVVEAFREHGLALSPTFVPFTPWTTPETYRDLVGTLGALGMAAAVAPVQLAIRLLIPAGSRLLELDEVRALAGPLDEASLVHPWRHADPAVDALQSDVFHIVSGGPAAGTPREELFERVARRAGVAAPASEAGGEAARFRLTPVPYLTEPWYC